MLQRVEDLSVGSKIKFGAYSVSGEEPHKVAWIKVHRDNTLYNEFVEDILPFDAREPLNHFRNRRTYGNNRYSMSNVCGFINSEKVDWFKGLSETDTPPTEEYIGDENPGYKNKPGFLSFFQPWELELILMSKVATKLNDNDVDISDGVDEPVRYDDAFQRVFLASWDNIFGEKFYEGEQWDYFANYGGRTCDASDACVKFSWATEKLNLDYDAACGYFLRTCHSNEVCYVKKIDTYGDCENEVASSGDTGLRVALVIDPNAMVSDEPDGDGYYQVLEMPSVVFDISEDEFLTLIKS